jgi:hypothetical protein
MVTLRNTPRRAFMNYPADFLNKRDGVSPQTRFPTRRFFLLLSKKKKKEFQHRVNKPKEQHQRKKKREQQKKRKIEVVLLVEVAALSRARLLMSCYSNL